MTGIPSALRAERATPGRVPASPRSAGIGDLALSQAFGALLMEWADVDRAFVDAYTTGHPEYRAALRGLDRTMGWTTVTGASATAGG